jgi:hypothetical protein
MRAVAAQIGLGEEAESGETEKRKEANEGGRGRRRSSARLSEGGVRFLGVAVAGRKECLRGASPSGVE